MVAPIAATRPLEWEIREKGVTHDKAASSTRAIEAFRFLSKSVTHSLE